MFDKLRFILIKNLFAAYMIDIFSLFAAYSSGLSSCLDKKKNLFVTHNKHLFISLHKLVLNVFRNISHISETSDDPCMLYFILLLFLPVYLFILMLI